MRRILAILLVSILFAASAVADTFQINISNPQYKPINVGLWGFVKNTPENISKRLLKTLKLDLELSGIFSYDLTQHFSYEAPQKVVIGIAKLDKMDYVIYGDAKIDGKNILVNVVIVDILKGCVILQKTYIANRYSLDWVANKIVDSLIEYTTGVYGPFESKILFAMGDTKTSDIYICDFNGENTVRITNWHTFNILPKWVSQDTITFLSYRYGKPVIFLYNIFNGNLRRLFNASNLSISAVRYLNYFAVPFNRYGSVNIYVINQRGRILRQLTNDPSINVSPSFTQDYSKMVFVSNRTGSPQIYIKDTSSFGTAKRLTFDGKYNSSPTVSPDGKKIAYISTKNGTTYLKVMNIDGSNDTVIMKGSSLDSPSWSYDSRYIALTGRLGNRNVIYIVNTLNKQYFIAKKTKFIYNGLSVSPKIE